MLHVTEGHVSKLHDLWEFPIDNNFAQKLYASLSVQSLPQPRVAKLCGKCQMMDLCAGKVDIYDSTDDLESSSKACDFCELRWQLRKRVDLRRGTTVYFDKANSQLRLNEGYPPVLTIHLGPSPSGKDRVSQPVNLQIGLPVLPQPGDSAHASILRHWLAECDDSHANCGLIRTKSMPTRLIYVGSRDKPSLKLYETMAKDHMKYFALSHPWGEPPHFCTFRSNIDSHKHAISFEDLPLTFQHAVITTRDLGLKYLWIDSICIIQGADGDFKSEAGRMEDVFSNAYCVLAASSTLGSRDGFLKKRRQRESILLKEGHRPQVFVCEFMDDFNHDVLESPLSRRGWVLQERALARRTIYFTDKQTYWECGEGVRCETMTQMKNTLASFLGDPSFPKVGMESSRGGKILLHQSLCVQYSRLALTRQTDRPIAISGLEKRLVESFGLSGGFGILHDVNNPGLLRRSMLWHRASDCPGLKRIHFDATAPPTWSWMSYEGQIEYLDLPFAKVTWVEEDFQTPWTASRTGRWYNSDDPPESKAMNVTVRDLEVHPSLMVKSGKIIMDIPDGTNTRKQTKCVVLGKLEGTVDHLKDGSETFAVLLVSADTSQRSSAEQAYTRMGVASVPGTWIKTGIDGSKGLLV